MNRILIKKYTVVILILLLSVTLVLPVFASTKESDTSEAANKQSEEIQLGSVQLSNQSQIELKQISMLPSQDGNVVSFTIRFVNGSSQDLSFIDYWFRLKSKSGSNYTINQLSSEKDKDRIASNSSQEFTFYASVGKGVKLEDLSIEIIKWDFSQSNYQRSIGIITIPKEYSDTTDVDQVKLLNINNVEIKSMVESVKVNKSSESYLTALNFEYENSGNRTVVIPDYNYYIQTSEGILYSVEIQDDKAVSIQPRVKKNIQLTAMIPISITPQGWKLFITVNESANIELPVASYELSDSAFDEISSNISEKKELTINSTPVESYIQRAVIRENKSGGKIESNIYLVFENKGNQIVTIPNYEYILKTKDDINYNLKPNTMDLTLNPRVSSEIELSVAIPSSISTEELELIINQVSDSGSNFPIAAFKVPKDADKNDIGLGQQFEFSNDNGAYGIKLNSLQRLPWGDEDIIAAEITLSNLDEITLPLINMDGYFKLDGIELDKDITQVVQLDKVMALQKNKNTKMVIYLKVPYTYEYEQISLVVSEKKTEDTHEIVVFESNLTTSITPIVKSERSHKISNVGQSVEIKVKEVHTYTNEKSKLLYSVFEVENLEKRQTDLIKLTGYLKSKDDVYFSAQNMEYDKKVLPGSKSLISFWSIVPEKYDISEFQLVVGEEINNGSDTAFINAVGFELPVEEEAEQTTNIYKEFNFSPYNFKIANIGASFDHMSAKVTFKYDLYNEAMYEVFPENHNIVIEFVHPRGTHYEVFEIGNNLKLGRNQSAEFSFSMDTSEILEKTFDDYLIGIYDEVNGHRKQLALGALRWHNTN